MTETNNKDYIINLRVSQETYEKIKTKAAENRDTVSHLVRKLIEDSGEIMQDLSSDIFNKSKKDKFKDIVGYHEATLARDLECAKCGRMIREGSKASVGETNSGARYYFCSDCA